MLSFPFLSAPLGAAYELVASIAHVLTPLTGGLATAAAIVVFTVGVRLLLSPLSFLAMRGQARIAAIQPRVAELRTRYARQPDKLQAELGTLYAQEAGGMMAGCLPVLLQIPFFSVMYRLFLSGTVDGHRNALLTRSLFGTPLGSHLLTGATLAGAHGLVFAGLLALLALAGYLSARLARALTPASAATQAGQHQPAQPQGALTAITRILPYTTIAIAAFVPLAAGIYLLTTTSWTLAERAFLGKRLMARPGRVAAGSLAGSAR
jgi:YidC/Oxa1 family membrane protein insertase